MTPQEAAAALPGAQRNVWWWRSVGAAACLMILAIVVLAQVNSYLSGRDSRDAVTSLELVVEEQKDMIDVLQGRVLRLNGEVDALRTESTCRSILAANADIGQYVDLYLISVGILLDRETSPEQYREILQSLNANLPIWQKAIEQRTQSVTLCADPNFQPQPTAAPELPVIAPTPSTVAPG